MRFRINILKKFIAIITIVLATAGQFAVFGQPNFVSAKYITPDQQTLEVRFDENLSWTSAGTWTVRIGGIPVVGVLGPGGNGTNILIFALPSVIDFSDVTAGVTIQYADDGDVAGPSGQLLAFGPSAAVNDVIITCAMLTGVQGISVDALSGPCAPVSVTITLFWEWSRQARNSVNFSNSQYSRIDWGDPANTVANYALTETALGNGIFQGTRSFTYPAVGTECVYTIAAFPVSAPQGVQPLVWCSGGSATMTQALTNWNTDNLATGQLQINPDLYQVCLGQDFTLTLDDATLFNCRKDIEPNKPNIGPRFVQFVYGTLGGRQIPDVYVGGVQVTDNAGNVLFPGGYVDPTVHYYDSGDVPFPNAVTLPVDHAGNLATDLVGDLFEVTIRNWNPCNPYLGGLGTPRETTALIEIVDGPIADAGPDQTICEGETATMSGGFSNAATAATWSTDGDGTFNNISNMGAIYTPGTNDISNGSVLLHLTATGPGGCPPFTDDILLTIDPAATPATTGSDDAVCGTSYPDLGGNSPNAGAGETGLWTVVSGNGNFTSSTSPNSGVNNLNPGPNVFRWTITRGLCTSSETITITRDQSPSPAAAGPDQDLCDNQSTVLNATPANNGGTGTWSLNSPPVWNEDFSGLANGTTSDAGATAWTSSSTSGTASEVVGGVFRVERATLNNWTSEVIDISANGFVDLSVDISGTGPMEDSDYLRVYYRLNGGGEVIFPINGNNFNIILNSPQVARANGLSGTTVQIIIRARTSQDTEVYTFDNIRVQPTLNFTNPNDPNTSVSGLVPGQNVLTWTVTSQYGACPTTSDDVIITRDITPDAADAGLDQQFCELTTATMAANSATFNGTGTWSILTAGPSVSDVNNPITAVTNLIYGNNDFRWTIVSEYGICPSSSSDVRIIRDEAPAAATTGPDQDLCGTLVSNPLGANAATVGVATWSKVSGPGTVTFATVNNPNTTATVSVEGSYVYRWTIVNGTCSTSEDITVSYSPAAPATPTIAGPANICEDDNSVNFTCNAVVGGVTYTWTVPATATITAGQGTTSITVDFTGVPVGAENVSVVASNACGSNPAGNYPITIEARALVNAGSDEETCENVAIDLSTITTLPSASNYASLLWTSTGTGTFNNPNALQPIYTPDVGETGNITLTLTASGNGSCPDVSDNLTLSVTPLPTANSGGNDDVCVDQNTYSITGASHTNGSILWTTSGDGSFSNNSIDNPVYTLGANDKTNGSVDLTMTVSSSGSCADAVSSMTLTITPLPTANSGGNDEVCADQVSFTVSGASHTFGSVAWSSATGGSFNDNSLDNPTYTLTAADKTNGSVVLTMTVTSPGSCAPAVSPMTLTVTPASIANAGGNDEVCEDQPTFTVTGASHANGSVSWSTGGDGTFVNANIDNPTYNLGPTDISSGSIVLTMTVSSAGSCADAVSSMTLNITPLPTANSGGDDEVCSDQVSFIVSGASHTNGSVAWSSPSGGTFNDNSLDNPTYTLTAADRTNGSVVLTMTVSSPGSCADAVSSMTLTITPLPTGNTGGDGEVCEDQNTYNISGASHTNGNVTWSSPSGGTFNDNTLDNPVYTLSAADKASGSVILSMTVTSAGSCAPAVETMTLTITPLPTASAGADDEICKDQINYTVSGATAANGSINWSTSGDGSFLDATALNPVYTIGPNDKTIGSVTLAIMVSSPGSCGPAVDNMTLSITPEPTANAGSDDEICASEVNYTVLGASFTNGNVIWTTNGDGSFTDLTATNPVYNIGATDRITGSVTLTMTVNSLGSCPPDSDEMILTLTSSPNTPPIAGGGATEMCVGTPPQYYSVPFNAGNRYVWNIPVGPVVVLGGGVGDNYVLLSYPVSGTFIIEVTEYTPLPANCPGPAQQIIANVYNPPTANAGSDVTVCAGSSAVLGGTPNGAGASASGGSGNFTYLWAPSFGLDDASAEHPNASPLVTTTYTLFVTDILSGCASVQDQVIVNVVPVAAVDAGTNEETCENMPFDLSTSGVIPSASNYSSVNWTTSGTGTFNNPNTLTPIYTPGAGEIGAVTLTLSATGNAPCGIVSDIMTLSITPAPVTDAGSDEETCEGTAFDLSLSTVKPNANNFISVSWTHSGTGSFNNPNILTPTYMPGAGETGIVTLTMTVTGNGSCTTAIDNMQLVVVDGPNADAGSNAEICEGIPFDLSTLVTPPTASNYVSVNWTHNGTGSFADPNILVPVYNPGVGETGIITLTMTVTGNAPCLNTTDDMALTIDAKPVLDPMLDKTICSDNTSGILLNVAGGSVAAVNYNINDIRVTPGLMAGAGNASPGVGQASIAIRDDIFTNETANPLTVEYDVIPVSADGCLGDMVTITLTVNPEPVLDPNLDNLICSGDISNITLATNGTSVVADVYNINAIRVSAGLSSSVGNATPGPGRAANAILNDGFTNTTANPLTVDYDIIPVSAAGCFGDMVTVTLTVNPEPVMAPGLNNSVCSDQPSSIIFATNGTSVNAAGYNIMDIRVDAGLIAGGGNSSIGNGQNANAISNDVFTNTTAGTLTVEYDVIPVSAANCEGELVTITLTVSAQPVMAAGLDNTVCSDNVSGIVFATDGTSIAAASYNILDIRVPGGLIPTGGNAAIGNGQSANAIANDQFSNTTGGSLAVQYDVVPVSGAGCLGDMITITLTVNPEPVLDPNLDNSVCSDQPSAITLNTNGISVAANGYNIVAIRKAFSLTAGVGNAVVGNGQAANAIASDIYTNTTTGSSTVEYDIVPVSIDGCEGNLVTVILTVDPKPVLNPNLDASVCSDLPSGITLNTNGLSVAAANYNINDIRVAIGLVPLGTNASIGNGQAANAIVGDIFTNPTAGTLTVEYDVVPVSAGGCLGDMVTVILTIDPEPVLDPNLDNTVCSDQVSGIVMNTDGVSIVAANYNIVAIRVPAGLTSAAGNSTVGNGKASNAIAGDVFTNQTAGSLTVEYDIVPVSGGGCLGDMETVSLTVDPEPVLDPNLDNTVCSDMPSGIVFNTNGTSVAAANYNIVNIRVAAGLVPDAGNAVSGNSQASNAIAADVFTNTTSGSLTVEYDIVPVSGGNCLGDMVTVTLTIDAKPVLDPNLNKTICSDNTSGIVLITNGVSITAANYNINDIRVDGGLTPAAGNASTGNAQAANAIAGDSFTNPTAGGLIVEYDIVPVSGDGCLGDMVTIILTVNPEPVLDPNLDNTVCSDEPSGITLNTDGVSIAAASYTILDIRVSAGLGAAGGNAIIGIGQAANAIVGDVFTNPTANPLTVEYDIVPVEAGGCEGDMLTITLTIDPGPVLDPNLNEIVCSDQPSGIMLNTDGISVPAANYNILDIRVDLGLIAAGGNAVIGNGQANNAITADVFTNTTAGSLTVEYDIVPISAIGCEGEMVTVVLIVNPEPVLDPNLDATVCSDLPAGITFNTIATSVAAANYTISDIRAAAGLVASGGNATIGIGQPASAIASDIFTNTSGGSLTVEYDVIPVSSNGCEGTQVTITLTIDPEPVLDPNLSATICSDLPSGIVLTTNGTSIAADNYNITGIRTSFGLQAAGGNASTGNGKAANAIANDIFTNTTSNVLTVEYDIIPVSIDGCEGDLVTVILTVNPEPVLASNLNTSICSDLPTGVTLNTNGISVAASSFNLLDIRVDAGIVAGAGNSSPANGLLADAIANDLFTNNTNGLLYVEYDVVPVSASGCEGKMVTVVITIEPEPVLDPNLDNVVCSDQSSGISLATNGISVPAANYNIIAIRVDAGLSSEIGNASVGNGQPAGAIFNDRFVNITSSQLTVEYDIVPVSAGGCEGDLTTVTLKIDPKPVMDPALDNIVCSDQPSSITLNTNGTSVGAASYNIISIRKDFNLIANAGNATTGVGQLADAIVNDMFTNNTPGALTVEYDIRPVSGAGCIGDMVTILLTVDPKPVMDPNLNKETCSNQPSGILLKTNGTSEPAASYNIIDIRVDAALIPDAGNASLGNGQADNAIIGDIFTNATSGTLNVEYDVVPISFDGCIGDMQTIILAVNPQPVLDPNLDAATCSEAASGITLAVDAGSVAAASYNVSLNSKDPALVGTPTTGLNLPSNAIASDMFRNSTGGPLTVIYDVIPISADGCEGNMVQVTLTVNPEPILASNLSSMTCSDAPGGIVFDVSAGSVAASSYNLFTITIPAGLIPGASNATIGTGMAADTISNDVFTNLTGGPQLVIYEVIPVSADGCEGDMRQVMLTVNPEPILDPGLNSTTCSDVASGINLSVAGGSVAASNYNVLAIIVDPGLVANAGNASPANGLSSTAIANDIFTNTATGALTVTYNVVPVSASGCEGDMVQITLIVNPEPILNPALDATVCSGLPSGIVLDVAAGSVGALTYNLVNITVSPGLVSQVGNATLGTAKPATVVTNDVFTNTTANPLTVTYGIIPVSADGCLGDLVQVILTVDPEPVIDPNLNTNICSDVASGIVINVAPTSVVADHFDISSITVDPSLVSNAGNALVGAGQDANAIAGDIFTNLTAGPLTVVYDVTPVSAAGCIGELVQITLTVNPEPILNPVGATVCSRNNSGIVFSVIGGSVAASTYNILAINMDPGLVAMAGNAVAGNGQSSNAISTDKFINTTNAALTVVYDVVPLSGVGCEGAMSQITFTIDPEPVLDPNLDTPVCSDLPVGVTLIETPGSVAAANYTINSVNVPAGIIPGVGNAGPGMGQLADAIANDIFTNQTANPLDVIYTVVPVSAIGCIGQAVQIAITVNPEPILSSGLNRAVCSDENTGIILDVSATSTAAATYNILNIMVDPSLTPDALNALAGNGLASTAIENDRFTNITPFPLNVVYDIVPVSADGCEGDMRQVIVTVQPKPILTPGLNETLCSNLPSNIILSVTNGVSGVTYNWDAPVLTGGMTGGTAGPSGIINDIFNNTTGSPQTATYRVVPMSGLGCLGDTSTVVITVNPNPTASINGGLDPLFVCGGEDLILNGNPADGSGNYVSHMWSGQIGSLDNITIQTPTFNTTFTGSYNLTYTVTDDNGCMGSDNVTINVDSPRALFSMSSNTGCNSVVVDFTNNSIGANTFTWDFGDGSPIDNTPGPSHTYNNLSTAIQYFNVKLFAESAGGCIDSVMQVVTVYPTVEASFTITPDTICHGDGPVQLAALPGGSAYHWDFGDGNSGYAGNVTTHSFTNTTTGIITRTVTLTTESFYGCTDVATQDIVIYPTPIPEFSPNPASQTWPNNQVQFINQTNAGNWTYFWNFGDGNTSTEEEPTNTYSVPGTFTVTLEVSNDRCSEVVSHSVEINPILPIASFAEVPPACSPYTIQFENTSQNATSYFWDFGDGTSSSEMNPEHTYYRGGTFVVRLTAIGPGGQDKYQQMVEVYQSPTAMLDVAPNTVYVNDKAVKCFNLSTYGDSYLWEFGDGNTDTIYEPYHVYMEEGIYDITLHVYSDNGCEDVFTLSPAVTVEPAGVLRYPTAFIPNKGGPTGGGVPSDPNLINSVFFPPIQQQVDDYHLEIFNRWGEKLFESNDINIGWDGYYKGQLCKQDVYVWQVKGSFNNGKPYRQAGDITLLHQ